EDALDGVVDLVSDAARERAERLELVTMANLALVLATLALAAVSRRHVAQERGGDQGGVHGHGARAHVEVDALARGVAVAGLEALSVAAEQPSHLLGRLDGELGEM